MNTVRDNKYTTLQNKPSDYMKHSESTNMTELCGKKNHNIFSISWENNVKILPENNCTKFKGTH